MCTGLLQDGKMSCDLVVGPCGINSGMGEFLIEHRCKSTPAEHSV